MKKGLYLLFIILVFTKTGWSRDNFNIDANLDGEAKSIGITGAEDVYEFYKANRLRTSYPTYDDPLSEISTTLDFRGLDMLISYPNTGSNRLTFSVPSLDINVEFTEATRNLSAEKLKQFLTKDGGDALNKIQKELARVSPIDPVAGNPASMMGQMTSGSFTSGFFDLTDVSPGQTTESQEPIENQIGVGVDLEKYDSNGNDVNLIRLPFSYTIRSKTDPRKRLSFKFPITYTDTNGASTYTLNLNTALSWPINKMWTLTPAASYGATGSIDLAGVGHLYGGSLSSHIALRWPKWEAHIGNMVGHFSTLPITYDDYKLDPEIANTNTRNGIMVRIPAPVLLDRISFEFFILDTRYFGDELYAEQYNEIGFSIGPGKSTNSSFKLGLTYLFASDGDIDSIKLNTGYKF